MGSSWIVALFSSVSPLPDKSEDEASTALALVRSADCVGAKCIGQVQRPVSLGQYFPGFFRALTGKSCSEFLWLARPSLAILFGLSGVMQDARMVWRC